MKLKIGNYEYAERHQKARVHMEKNNLNALLITEPTNLFYYTGAHISERCHSQGRPS